MADKDPERDKLWNLRWREVRCPKGDFYLEHKGAQVTLCEPPKFCPNCGAALGEDNTVNGLSVPIRESGSAVNAVRKPYPIHRNS